MFKSSNQIKINETVIKNTLIALRGAVNCIVRLIQANIAAYIWFCEGAAMLHKMCLQRLEYNGN